jgi:hypothetical protein
LSNSTTFTSTCTTPPLATVEVSVTAPLAPAASAAAARACLFVAEQGGRAAAEQGLAVLRGDLGAGAVQQLLLHCAAHADGQALRGGITTAPQQQGGLAGLLAHQQRIVAPLDAHQVHHRWVGNGDALQVRRQVPRALLVRLQGHVHGGRGCGHRDQQCRQRGGAGQSAPAGESPGQENQGKCPLRHSEWACVPRMISTRGVRRTR